MIKVPHVERKQSSRDRPESNLTNDDDVSRGLMLTYSGRAKPKGKVAQASSLCPACGGGRRRQPQQLPAMIKAPQVGRKHSSLSRRKRELGNRGRRITTSQRTEP